MKDHIPGVLNGRRINWCPDGDGYLPFCPQPTDPDEYSYCCMYYYLEVDMPSCCPYPIRTGLIPAFIVSGFILLFFILFFVWWCKIRKSKAFGID
ncbi:unnamed protein product, partial [Mesorhabditis belari]|uniref:Uncharacterized protein n=1 Tax=Mesorhabditis belari TaxID=2138241 RepID=A0AAF3EX99_9BILA